jgi:hypothetical protein
MDPIITQLLSQVKVSDLLEYYKYIPFGELESIPLGSHIKFIDRNENIKSGGFLIKISINPDRTKTYIILKSNLMYKLYPYYYWIFFKQVIHESKVDPVLEQIAKPVLTNNSDSNTTTMSIVINSKPSKNKSKSSFFKVLLETLDKQKV